MKSVKRIFFSAVTLMFIASACGLTKEEAIDILSSVEQTAAASITYVPVSATPDVNVIVAQTFAAMTAQAGGVVVQPTFTQIVPSSATGSISGTLSYPSNFIPSLRVVAVSATEQGYSYIDTQPNQSTYTISGLAPGKYHVIAYAGGELSAGYTLAVLCGLSVECTDHSLIDVVVVAGADTPNVNPQDWYAPPGSFPPMPAP